VHYTPSLADHHLPHDPLLALVAPRPIGWISTLNAEGGVNLAPYSFFNLVAYHPPQVMFSSTGRKDSQANAEATGEFVCSLATWDLREAMNLSSAPVERGLSEPELIGLAMAPSRTVRPPRVAASPAALECRYWRTVELKSMEGRPASSLVLGEVTGIYIDDAVIEGGRVNLALARPLARLGYMEFATLGEIFSMARPAAQDLAGRNE